MLLFTYSFVVDKATAHLSTLAPSAVDFELHSIPTSESDEWLLLTISFFKHQLETNDRFELIQACIHFYALTKIALTVIGYESIFKNSRRRFVKAGASKAFGEVITRTRRNVE